MPLKSFLVRSPKSEVLSQGFLDCGLRTMGLRTKKGVSLPLVIGLVSVLMVASVSINELILRALSSAHNVEAADRAYFAAEAGIENALYELSPHFAGYETTGLGATGSRNEDFKTNTNDVTWKNNWEIKSVSHSTSFNGQFFPNQKLTMSLFDDTSGNPTQAPATDAINSESANIVTIDTASNFQITFQIPFDTPAGYSNGFLGGLAIDNDGDAGVSAPKYGINEDGPNDTNTTSCNNGPGVSGTIMTNDIDCDGRYDSVQDPVIYWKITDDQGNSLTPKKGCIGNLDPNYPSNGSEICENSFQKDAVTGLLSIALDQSRTGINEKGDEVTIQDFLAPTYPAGNSRGTASKLQIEFLIVAPLEQAYFDGTTVQKIPIPYLSYHVTSNSDQIPLPVFTLKSDGFYRDFKQSITTVVTPKTAAPLFEFTIIQQQ